MRIREILLGAFLPLAFAEPSATIGSFTTGPTGTATTHFNPTFTQTNTAKIAAATSAVGPIYISWESSPQYTSIEGAVFDAAPSAAQKSLAIQGWNWDTIVAQDWYAKGVPQDVQSSLSAESQALQSAVNKAIGNAGSRMDGWGVKGMVVLLGAVVMGGVILF